MNADAQVQLKFKMRGVIVIFSQSQQPARKFTNLEKVGFVMKDGEINQRNKVSNMSSSLSFGSCDDDEIVDPEHFNLSYGDLLEFD